ncbi:hypothetical protein BLJ79_21545 [Arthrobacter sp. UCD-GKA]|nr:hypothetical protein BLJ79_21545 [Arthrobacter sp. UCD-GKA]
MCSWLEADAEARGGEPVPEGNNFASAELDGRHEPMHMHGDHNRQSIDDDDSGVYRTGFNNDHRRKF